MNRSYLTGLRVKSGPTTNLISISTSSYPCVSHSIPNVGFVIILFHAFFFVFFPVPMALNISSSLMPLTFGNGTEYFAAFSFLLFLIAELKALALEGLLRSSKY